MKQLKYLCAFLCMLGCSVDPVDSSIDTSNVIETPITRHGAPKEIVVRFSPHMTEAQKAVLRSNYGVVNYRKCSCPDPGLEAWELSSSLTDIELEERVRSAKSESGMEGADFNFRVGLSGQNFNPNYSQEFHQFAPLKHQTIQLSTGISKRSTATNDPVIGVIDSGIDPSNPHFVQNFLYNGSISGASCVDSNGQPDAYGWNFVDDTNNPYDDLGHGTKVSYFIYNQVFESGHTARIIPAKAFNAEGGSLFNISCAFSYLLKKDVDVINMSFGFNIDSSVFESYLKNAQNQQVIITTSAGNTGADNDLEIHNPSNYTRVYPYMFSVAVVNSGFQKVNDLTNYGAQTVDLAVNAVGIQYKDAIGPHYITGSSYASALMAGNVAVLLNSSMPPEQLKTQMLNHVIATSNLDGVVKEGGYLNFVVY